MADHNRFYTDACPRCSTVVRPGSGIAAGRCLTAAYRCRCGHTWTCSWALVPGRVLPPQPGLGEAA